MLVFVCLVGSKLIVHAKPEKLRPSQDTTEMHRSAYNATAVTKVVKKVSNLAALI
jgi:hypothetical protein